MRIIIKKNISLTLLNGSFTPLNEPFTLLSHITRSGNNDAKMQRVMLSFLK